MTKYLFSVNIILNLLIKYDTNYNLLHHHSQRFNFRFLVSNSGLTTLIKFQFLRLCLIIIHSQKTRFPVTTYIFFREGLLEYRVCTLSEKWCWKTFLRLGITEHRIFGFVSIVKSSCGRPPLVKLYACSPNLS